MGKKLFKCKDLLSFFHIKVPVMNPEKQKQNLDRLNISLFSVKKIILDSILLHLPNALSSVTFGRYQH